MQSPIDNQQISAVVWQPTPEEYCDILGSLLGPLTSINSSGELRLAQAFKTGQATERVFTCLWVDEDLKAWTAMDFYSPSISGAGLLSAGVREAVLRRDRGLPDAVFLSNQLHLVPAMASEGPLIIGSGVIETACGAFGLVSFTIHVGTAGDDSMVGFRPAQWSAIDELPPSDALCFYRRCDLSDALASDLSTVTRVQATPAMEAALAQVPGVQKH